MKKVLCMLVALLLTLMSALVVELHWGGDVDAREDSEQVRAPDQARSGSVVNRAALRKALRQ